MLHWHLRLLDTLSARDVSQDGEKNVIVLLSKQEGTARYTGLLLAPAEGFGLWQRLFGPLGEKTAFHAVGAYFRPFLVFSSNLRKVY